MRMTLLGLLGLSILFVWLMKLTQKKDAMSQRKPLLRSTKIAFTITYIFGAIGGVVNRYDIFEIFVVPVIPALLVAGVAHLIFNKKSK